MPRINVAKVINDTQFQEDFTVYRQTGAWQGGRFVVSSPVPILFTGVVVAGGTKDINQVPEADRTSEIMIFLSTEPMYVTSNDMAGKPGTSDQILWNGDKYRIYQVKNWSNHGYYRAIGVSMEGD